MKFQKYIMIAGVLVVIALVSKTVFFNYKQSIHQPEKDRPILPCRTVNNQFPDKSLFGYVLHKGKRVNEDTYFQQYTELCAVTKDIDPQKDDFRTTCKSIISDIVRSDSSNKIVVTIFDNDEAYSKCSDKGLDEIDFELEDKSMDLMRRHVVAVYYGDLGDDAQSNYRITYYPYDTAYSTDEHYRPE